MSFLSGLNRIIPGDLKASKTPPSALSSITDARYTGYQNIVLYPTNDGSSYIKKGYNKNAQVYSIVKKNASKLGQVNFYHYRIKAKEQKTWEEYLMLTKQGITSENILEAKSMRKKSIDENKVDSALSKLLKKPNRNQTGAIWREMLYGYKQLTGEGDMVLIYEKNKPVTEIFVVPKSTVQLITGGDPFTLGGYQFTPGHGVIVPLDLDQVILWAYPNYDFSAHNLSHLRGQSPLDAGLLTMQALNEGAITMVKMNANQGAAGMAFNKENKAVMDPKAASALRRMFNDNINAVDMAGAIAMLNGDWGYHQFGLDAQKLQMLEQTDVAFDTLCNIFDTPPGMFVKNQTYENQKQCKLNWIYDNIAPAAYSLRDELNEKLILKMGLDRERDFVDCDILGLPEMAIDLKRQVDALGKVWQITPNEFRQKIGEEKSTDKNMDKIIVPNNMTTLDDLVAGVGGNLDNELNLLNNQ